MGVHIDSTTALGMGFHRRVSDLTTNELFDLASLLRIETYDAPDTDLYDWLRQRIYDELSAIEPRKP